jgi:AmiR/NasT family two-component response regulator
MTDTRVDSAVVLDRLLREREALRTENEQLRTALVTRIVIEQAKGVLAERFALVPDVAFEVLRRGARSTGRKIHDLANEVVTSSATPAAIARELRAIGRKGAA